MKAILEIRSAVWILLVGATLSARPGVAYAQAPRASKPLATMELDVPGVVAEVFESTRKDGMLTVRIRFRNTGAKAASLTLATHGHSKYKRGGEWR